MYFEMYNKMAIIKICTFIYKKINLYRYIFVQDDSQREAFIKLKLVLRKTRQRIGFIQSKYSKKMIDIEKKYHSYELENLVIINAVMRLRAGPARQALILEEYEYSIGHWNGSRLNTNMHFVDIQHQLQRISYNYDKKGTIRG